MVIAKNCHLISVTSGKGGTGKSMVAANLAVTLHKEFRTPVLAIDLDSKSCGDQNIIFGLNVEKDISDLVNSKQSISLKNLDGYISKHASGVHLLAAVKNAGQNLSVSGTEFSKLVGALSQFYKYIVVDVGTEITDLQLKSLENSSSVLVVTTPDVLTVNQNKKFLTDMMSKTFPIEMFKIILNKQGANSLRPEAISKALALQISGIIPQDEVSALGSLNKKSPFTYSSPRSLISESYKNLVRKITGGQLDRIKSLLQTKVTKKSSEESPSNIDDDIQFKIQIHNELIKEMDLKNDVATVKDDPKKNEELRKKTSLMITKIVDKRARGVDREKRAGIIQDVLDEALGLGPLETLLSDDSVTEIMVNGARKIFVEKNGRVTLSKSQFTSNQQLRTVIERIVTPLGRRIDEKSPYCDARLADGSRVNAVIEPLAIDGPALTIRKFSKDEITHKNYLTWGSMSEPMVNFLRICVEQGQNIIISGGTGSGKTTLLNTMSGFIPANERIVTIEDAAELQLKQEHVVRLETKPSNMDGEGAVTIRDLVKNSLRMRPDRVIVGECRDGAALDMLQAMNTGHDGSMTTVHANSPKEAVGRLETLCMMAGMDLPAKAIRDQVAGAVNLFVQIGRLSDGSRKVKYITEVGMLRGEVIELQDIFLFKEEGFDKNRKIVGSFKWTGNIPKCVESFEKKGVSIPRSIFSASSEKKESESNKAPVARRPLRAAPSVKPVSNLKKPSSGSKLVKASSVKIKKASGDS